ncbi:hypothetical protein BXY51_004609 [Actinoplanes cyaneus]|nr:hypothetical protein [Actinoplanes cyaneus]
MTRIRLDDSLGELDGLRNEILTWVSATRRHDADDRHGDHLQAIEEVTTAALLGVREWLLDQTTGRAQGEVYTECRRADLRVVRIRRFWRWYADRLDQYARSPHAGTLAAADEIVRSSWHEVFTAAGGADVPPVPLTAVADVDVPTALARAEVPWELKAPADEMVATWTARMPIATITLPVAVLTRPWWLILAVHEAGHHVHAELFRAGDAVDSLVTAAEQAVDRAGAGREERTRWARWSAELFADAFAVVLAGSAPAWSVAELELADDDTLLAPGPSTGRYPPPLVRWLLADAVASRLGVADPVTGTRARLLDRHPRARDLVSLGTGVAEALLDLPLGTTCLRRIGLATAGWQQTALSWRQALLARAEPLPRRRPESARLCAAGGTLAWFVLAADPEGPAPDRIATVNRRMLELVPRCGPTRVRTSAPAAIAKGIAAAAESVLADLRSDSW